MNIALIEAVTTVRKPSPVTMYLVIIESTISALVGIRAHWKTIPRTGDVEVLPG
jgi:hypothetical protein